MALSRDSESLLATGIGELAGDGDLDAGRRWFDSAYEAAERAWDVPLPAIDLYGPSASAATCSRQGHTWRFDWGIHIARVPHSIGMLHLAMLLANPGSEIPAADLVAGSKTRGAGISARQRPAQLDDSPPEEAERDWLLAELAAATGRGGPTRQVSDSQERARIAVGKAIRRALARIGQADPLVAEHLRSHLHTGFRCSYQPPRLPSRAS